MNITDSEELKELKPSKHPKQQLRQISVSKTNYLELKRLGGAGDSFNDVITEALKKIRLQN